jgi:hypothetical protein
MKPISTLEYQVLGLWKSTQSHRNVSSSCKMHCVLCNKQARAYWTDLCGRHHNKPVAPAATAKCGHSGSRACVHKTFPPGWSIPTYSEHHLGHSELFCSHVLSNCFPEHFGCGCSWPMCSLNMNLCDCFLWAYKKTLCTTPACILFRRC